MSHCVKRFKRSKHTTGNYTECHCLNLFSIERICKKCPESWRLFENKCYYFSSRMLTWSSGRAWCRTQGGDLLIVDSEPEQVEDSRALFQKSVSRHHLICVIFLSFRTLFLRPVGLWIRAAPGCGSVWQMQRRRVNGSGWTAAQSLQICSKSKHRGTVRVLLVLMQMTFFS